MTLHWNFMNGTKKHMNAFFWNLHQLFEPLSMVVFILLTWWNWLRLETTRCIRKVNTLKSSRVVLSRKLRWHIKSMLSCCLTFWYAVYTVWTLCRVQGEFHLLIPPPSSGENMTNLKTFAHRTKATIRNRKRVYHYKCAAYAVCGKHINSHTFISVTLHGNMLRYALHTINKSKQHRINS